MTYSGDASEAIRALGDEANDTDRSLEDMTELGAALYNKLGVPMDKVGEAIKRIRSVATDLQTAGGHIALEDSLVRLAPLPGELPRRLSAGGRDGWSTWQGQKRPRGSGDHGLNLGNSGRT